MRQPVSPRTTMRRVSVLRSGMLRPSTTALLVLDGSASSHDETSNGGAKARLPSVPACGLALARRIIGCAMPLMLAAGQGAAPGTSARKDVAPFAPSCVQISSAGFSIAGGVVAQPASRASIAGKLRLSNFMRFGAAVRQRWFREYGQAAERSSRRRVQWQPSACRKRRTSFHPAQPCGHRHRTSP